MRTLIVYASKYGFTEHVARLIADRIEGDVELRRCGPDFSADLTKFQAVIIGSPIYVGRPNEFILDFCENYQRLLASKSIAFFTTGVTGENAVMALVQRLPETLVQKAKGLENLGYALDFSKMRWIDRLAARIAIKMSESEMVVEEQRLGHLVKNIEIQA